MKTMKELEQAVRELPADLSPEEYLKHPLVVAAYREWAKASTPLFASMAPCKLKALLDAMCATVSAIYVATAASVECRDQLWSTQGVLYLAMLGAAQVLAARDATSN